MTENTRVDPLLNRLVTDPVIPKTGGPPGDTYNVTEVTGTSVGTGPTLPDSAADGDLFYDTDDEILYVYYSSAWHPAGSGGSSGAVYEYQNYEKTSTYVYVGYATTGGAWFIYRRTIASGVREYASGSSSYATNWTGRAGLTYA